MSKLSPTSSIVEPIDSAKDDLNDPVKDPKADPKEAGSTDPFDIAALRINPSFLETAGVKKLLTTVPIRRPTRQEFFRTHPDEAYRNTFAAIDLKDDREVYIVHPIIAPELAGETIFVTLFTAINRQGTVFLWPVRLPTPEKKNQTGGDRRARPPSWR